MWAKRGSTEAAPQPNCPLHMIAVIRARGVGPGRACHVEHQAGGKDRVAALMPLRRRVLDAVCAVLRAGLRASRQPAHLSVDGFT